MFTLTLAIDLVFVCIYMKGKDEHKPHQGLNCTTSNVEMIKEEEKPESERVSLCIFEAFHIIKAYPA